MSWFRILPELNKKIFNRTKIPKNGANFQKISKNFQKNFKKFSKNFKKFQKIFKKFSKKIFKKFSKKIFKKFSRPCLPIFFNIKKTHHTMFSYVNFVKKNNIAQRRSSLLWKNVRKSTKFFTFFGFLCNFPPKFSFRHYELFYFSSLF